MAGQYSGVDRSCSPVGALSVSGSTLRETQPIASMHLNVPLHGGDGESSDSVIICMQSSDMIDAITEERATGCIAAIAVAWPAKPSRAANRSKILKARIVTPVA
jgi:hypothetical protein